MNIKAVAVVYIVSCIATFAQENYSTWSKYRDITINTTNAGGGANTGAAVSNYPVLVRLTAVHGDVFTQAVAGGLDIRFASAAGAVPLKYQRERWDATSQLAEFWVLVPSIAANASTTLRMYWGKAGAADSTNGMAVFDTSNGFIGNWHMGKGQPSSTTVLDSDATINNNHLRWMNGVTSTGQGAVVEGLIGKADSLYNPQVANTTGATNATFLTKSAMGNASFATNTGALTMSAWVKRTGPGGGTVAQSAVQDEGIIGRFRFSGSGLNLFDLEYTPNPGGSTGTTVGTGSSCTGGIGTKALHSVGYTFHYFTNTTGGTERYACSDVTSAGGWDYVVGTMTATQQIIYVNGIAIRTLADAIGGNILAGTTATTNWGNTALVIGKIDSADNTYNQSFNGVIDEVGFSKTVRDSNWVKLNYSSQKPGATCVTVGPTFATATVPGAPLTVTGVAGNGQVAVSWLAPTSNGGAAITIYTVTTVQDTSKRCTTTGTLTCNVISLTNGSAYSFTVTATNTAGTGSASAASPLYTPVLPPGVPGAPTGLTGVAGNGQVVVSWIAPTSNGGSAITIYSVTAAPGSASCAVFTATSGSCTVTGLINGTAYTFTATATNSSGISLASTPSTPVIPLGPPGAPTGVTGIGGVAQVLVSWLRPTDTGGTAITGYTVTTVQDTAKKCTTTTALSCTVTGLAAGISYTFTVKATNAVGTGPASVPSTAVTTGILGFSAKQGLEIRSAGSTVVFRLPSNLSGAHISVMDIWGRTVWSQRVGAGVNELSWDGKSEGRLAVRGIYLARVTASKSGKSKVLAEAKITLLP